MAVTTREEFKEYILRKLGKPVLDINVSDEQVEDRIDEALLYYYDYHFDGSEKEYYKHELTQTDKDNGYITIPENIVGAVRIFDVGNGLSGSDGLFNIRYQIALNDLYTLTSQSLVPYYMAVEQLQFMEQLLVGKPRIRFNRMLNRLYIDIDKEKLTVGNYVVVEAYKIADPETYPDVWNDRWLKHYAAALVKRQWGQHLMKFDGVALPGGVQFNGRQIYDDAEGEIQQLEQEMLLSYSIPPEDMIG